MRVPDRLLYRLLPSGSGVGAHELTPMHFMSAVRILIARHMQAEEFPALPGASRPGADSDTHKAEDSQVNTSEQCHMENSENFALVHVCCCHRSHLQVHPQMQSHGKNRSVYIDLPYSGYSNKIARRIARHAGSMF
jgi:hypothetical protein